MMNAIMRRLGIGVLSAALLVPLSSALISAAGESVTIIHCAPGRGGVLNCKQLVLDPAAAAAHLVNHPFDSRPDNIVWGP